MTSIRAAAGLIVLLVAARSLQQSPACSLLTAAEIEAATGAKPSAPVSEDAIVKSTPGAQMCMWNVGASVGQLSVTAGPVPPGINVAALAKKNPGVDALLKANYTMVEKTYGTTWCSVMSPPASIKDGTFLTSCAGPVNGKAVSIKYMSQTQTLDLDKTKALLDKALSRQR